MVAIESGTRAGFETPSFRAKTRARSRLWRRIFLVRRQKPRPFRPGFRHTTRRPFHRIARTFRGSARSLEDQRFRTIAQSWPKIRLDHGVFDQLLPLSSVEGTLGDSGMGFFPGRFAATPRPGRQDFLWTESSLQRRLLHAGTTRSFHKPRRRGRARTNFIRERNALLALAAELNGWASSASLSAAQEMR